MTFELGKLYEWDPEPYSPTFQERDRKGRMKTVHGKPATRRVKQLLANGARFEDGKLFLPSFFVYVVQPDARLYLAYAGTQFFVDKRGRYVLPHSQFVHEERTHVVVYSLLIEKGKLQEAADSLYETLNGQAADFWMPPPGVKLRESPFFARGINHA